VNTGQEKNSRNAESSALSAEERPNPEFISLDRVESFESLIDGWFWETNADHRFTYISRKVVDLTGYSQEWHYGKSLAELSNGDSDGDAWRSHLDTLTACEPFVNFVYLRKGLKAKHWISTSGNPRFNDEGIFLGYVGTGQVVATAKDTETTYEKPTTQLQKVFEVMDDGVILFDAQDRMITCNAYYRDLYLKRVGEIVPGTTLEAILRAGVEKGLFASAVGRVEQWVAERLKRHREELGTFEHILTDGRIIRVKEHRTPDNGTLMIVSDVTAVKQAEMGRTLTESILNLGSWRWSVDCDEYISRSDGFAKLLGLSTDDMKGLDAYRPNDLVHPDDKARVDAAFETFDNKPGRIELEYRIIRSDGEIRDIYEVGECTVQADDRPFEQFGVMQDVTDRKRTEGELAHAQAQANIGNYRWSIGQEKFVSWSPQFAHIHGLDPNDITPLGGDFIYSMIHPDDVDRIQQKFDALDAKGTPFECEYRIIRPNGEVRHLLERGEAVLDKDGRAIEQIGTVQDITELKRVEIELERAQELTHIGSWRWSPDQDRLLSCSPEYARIFGVDMENIFHLMNHQAEQIVHPDDKARVWEAFERIDKGTDAYSIEYRIIRPDGTVRDVLEIGETDVVGDGKRREQFGTIQDVTALKQAERAAIAARNEAESATQAKSSFLASMSHELRTPMNSILGFGQLLADDPSEPLSDIHQRFVGQILDNGAHLLALIDQVLDLSRIEHGKLESQIIDVSLEDVVQTCLRITAPLASKRAITILPGQMGSLAVRADARQLRQVILNLLSNAVKYNRENGTISIEAQPGANRFVRLSITDTGGGISVDRQAKLFEAFNRLGREQSNIEGTGIGLTIVKQLVESMDGRVGFDSTLGKGSTFWVELPEA